MLYSYPARLKPDEAGHLVVHFSDLPEALTDGANEAEALSEAADCLSTALAALGGAVVLGLKEGPKLNLAGRVLILASTFCFVFSAYFALLWQSWLAEVYYLECPSLVTQQVMRFPFIAHTYFFVFGLALIGLVVLSATFGKSSRTSSQTGSDDNEPSR